MENKITLFAFAAGSESTEAPERKVYVGIAPVFVLAVNPSKSKLEELQGRTLEKDPEYVTTQENGNKQARIDFIVKTDEEKCGVDMDTKITFFVNREYRFNKEKTKVQVIDKYGRTAWVTKEEAQKREIPTYSNGKKANLDQDYRPCYVGEEELTEFIKTYLGIPNVMRYVDNEWKLVDNPSECEARLDSIDKYFEGDFSELEACINLQPKNKIKVLFGVKTTEDNRQFQTVYTRMFLRNNARDFSKIQKDLQERKDAGAYGNVEFQICPLKEYKVEATDFSKEQASEMPFDTEASPWFNA